MVGKYTTVSIPVKLKERVQEFIKNTGFTSVSKFTEHILRDIISGGKLESELTGEEVRKVRERLKKLGYIQ